MQTPVPTPAFPTIAGFPLTSLMPRLLEKLRLFTAEEAAAAMLKLPEQSDMENPPPPIANLKDNMPLWALILYIKHKGIDEQDEEVMDDESISLSLLCSAILDHEYAALVTHEGNFEVLRNGSLLYLPEEE